MAKRSIEDEYDVSEIIQSKRARVHGVVTELSPIKVGKKSNRRYFEGQIADGKKSVRMVSFHAHLRDALHTSLNDNSSVILGNCNIECKTGQETIFLNEKSVVQRSPKKFEVSTNILSQHTELCDLNQGNTIKTKVKVLRVSAPETIESKQKAQTFQKQDCVVSDSSGCCRLVLWESHVGKFEVGKCYKLIGVLVRCFNDINYLSVSANSEIEKIDDIGEVVEVENTDVDRPVGCRVIEGSVVGVRCISYDGCGVCKVKVESTDGVFGECHKCKMLVKMTNCEKLFTATVRINDNNGQVHDIKLFHDRIAQLIDKLDNIMDIQKSILLLPIIRVNVGKKQCSF